MTGVFVDSNVFIAYANIKDRDHARAKQLVEDMRMGEFGKPLSLDCVFDEAVTTTLLRTRRSDLAVKVGKIILGSRQESIPRLVRLVHVDDTIFAEAWRSFQAVRFGGKLSFTDHTILAQMMKIAVGELISFDSGFDGLVARIS